VPSGKFLKVRVQGPSRNSAEKRVLALRDEWQKMGTDANSKEAGSQQHFQTINQCVDTGVSQVVWKEGSREAHNGREWTLVRKSAWKLVRINIFQVPKTC
jgi:hypothetical protein